MDLYRIFLPQDFQNILTIYIQKIIQIKIEKMNKTNLKKTIPLINKHFLQNFH